MAPNPVSPAVRNLLLLFLLAFAVPAAPEAACAAAKTQKTPAKTNQKLALNVEKHKDFDRIVFNGARGLSYELIRKAEKVSLRFSVVADIDLKPTSKLTRAREFYSMKEASGGKGSLIIGFYVAPSAIIKDSAKGATITVDIYGPLPQAETAGAPAITAATQETVAKESKEPSLQAEFAANTPATTGRQEQKQAEGKTSPSPAPFFESASPGQAPLPEKQNAHAAKENRPELVVTFDPKIDTGLAVFERGGFVTVIFDRKITMDKPALTAGSPLQVQLEAFDMPKNTGFRFPLPEGTSSRVSREGTAWKIFFVKDSRLPAVSTTLVAQPDFALGARIMLPVKNAPSPLRFADPVVGDELVVLPLHEPASFSITRRLVDFMVIPSAQGLVIKPLNEKTTVRSFAEGVEITAEGGLKLSPASETGARQKTSTKIRGGKSGGIIFDIELWKGRPGESFITARQKLARTIAEVPESQRNLARLELARFYFAHGMGEETLALLNLLAKNSPDLLSHPEFLALRGAASILAGNSEAGLRDLENQYLESQAEMKLWRAVGRAQLRDWNAAEENFNFVEELLASYPEPFHSRFSILAIEAALGAEKDREAAEWLDRLERQPHMSEIDPAIKYLRGVLHSKAGRAEEAEKMWKEVSLSSDRLYKIRAELALVDLKVAMRSMTPMQAAERLEGMKYAWRGDDLEVDILRRLGNFYIEAKNFKAGLAILARAVRLYPKSQLTPQIRAEMAKTFHDLFLTDIGADFSPVEALTIYQSYPELLPAGEEGFALKSNLAERLVAIDLLDQAAALIEDQVKNSLKGEDKMRAGTRLAAIRLLDGKPEAALAALDASQADIASEAVANDLNGQRRLLRARALSEQGKNDEALNLLQNDESKTAKALRADINIRAKRWAEAGRILLDLTGPPPLPGGQLSEEQAQWLVKCAIALSLAGDMQGVDRLAIDYGAAMSTMPQRDTFRVLTRPENVDQMRDIAAAQAKISEVDVFRGFLDAYRDPNFGKKKETEKKR